MSTQDYTEKVWSPWSHYKEVARMKGETKNVQRPEAGRIKGPAVAFPMFVPWGRNESLTQPGTRLVV